MNTRPARRILELPPYLFAELDTLRSQVRERGVDVIDLGVGDPDSPTPAPILAALGDGAARTEHHRYPAYAGHPAFRRAVSSWFAKRFGVQLDPDSEVLALLGSKEGIAHFPLAFVDPGDVVLVPDPGYPVYTSTTRFVGGEVHALPLREEHGFLPDSDSVPSELARRARALWINFPGNPTSAVASVAWLERAVAFCRAHDIILCSDAAYTEIYPPGAPPPPSVLAVPGARDITLEFHSFSKTFNMTGWRLGFACGPPSLVGPLAKVKTHVDSGVFGAVQDAGIRALELEPELTAPIRQRYAARRGVMEAALRELGITPLAGQGTFYVWSRVPEAWRAAASPSREFCKAVLERAGVVVTPGVGFGEAGEGYFRISLTTPEDRLVEAARRIRELAF